MEIYLAGENGKWRILSELFRGGEMKIYLAGGFTGNLAPEWKKIAIGGAEAYEHLFSRRASREERQTCEIHNRGGQGIKILESFYACEKNKYIPELLPYISDFLLDSGAFTFIRGTHKEAIDWEEYTERFASWINKYDIKKFFELDIDPIVGLQEVERLRKRLETLTNKQPIPVWHKNRGKEYFIKMCEEYSYVAIGGIVNKEIDRELYERLFPWFIDTAHKNGAKIHGLGYTALANLKKFHFDSVDSTAWLYGNRSGNIYIFNPHTGLMEQHSREGRRLKSQEAAKNNFLEWVKFQNYAERNL